MGTSEAQGRVWRYLAGDGVGGKAGNKAVGVSGVCFWLLLGSVQRWFCSEKDFFV